MRQVFRLSDVTGSAGEPVSAMDRPVHQRRWSPDRVAVTCIIVLALAGGAGAYARYGMERTVTLSANRMTVSPVRLGVFRDYAPVNGAIAPIDSVFLDSLDGGQVVEILVEEGASVQAGQPIVRLANRRLQMEMSGSEAQVAAQQNSLINLQLAYAQSDLQHRQALAGAEHQIAQLTAGIARYTPLVDKGLYPRASLEEMERDLHFQQAQRMLNQQALQADRERMDRQLAVLRAANARQDATLVLIRRGLSDLTVTAPIGGLLSSLSVQPGQAIAPGQRIGQIDRADRFKVVAQVDEFYLGRIAPGLAATATLDGKSQTMRVAKVYPEVRDRQFKADLAFAGPAPVGMHTGQSVSLRIELGERPNSLLVDNGAFDEAGGVTSVFVVSPGGGRATRRRVQLGRQNAEAVEVLSGLRPGERIVTSADESLRDIQRINITGALRTTDQGRAGQ